MLSVTCENCGGDVPFTRILKRGKPGPVRAHCGTCGKAAQRGTTQYTLADFQPYELDAMPIEEGDGIVRRCPACKRAVPQLELHHLWPREAYGDTCGDRPQIEICGDCHDDWHERIKLIGLLGVLRDMRGAGQTALADQIARTVDAVERLKRCKQRDTRTLTLAPEMSPQLQERFDRARKASEGNQ